MQQDHDARNTIGPPPGIRERPSLRDQEDTAVLTIAAFGTPLLRLGNDPLVFARRKTTALLLHLAVTRHVHSRDALADLLWGDLPQDRAMANLRKSLSELRERVGGALSIAFHTAAINPDYPIVLDVAIFAAAVARGIAAEDAPLLMQAVAIYPADFLAGFNVPQAETFDAWASLYRAHLRDQLLAALEALVMLHVARGAYRMALGPARRVVALDPWREEGQRQVMRVLAATGDRAVAVAQYAVCRRTLMEELGVEPTAETVALYEQLRAGTGAAGTDGERPVQVWGQRRGGETVPHEAWGRTVARRRGRSLLRACSLPGLLAGAACPGGRVPMAQRHLLATAGQSGRGELRGTAAPVCGVYTVAAGGLMAETWDAYPASTIDSRSAEQFPLPFVEVTI